QRTLLGDKAKQEHAREMAFSGDGKTIYALVNDKPSVMAIDARSGKLARALDMAKADAPHQLHPFRLYQRNGFLAVLGPGSVLLWDLKSGNQLHRSGFTGLG